MTKTIALTVSLFLAFGAVSAFCVDVEDEKKTEQKLKAADRDKAFLLKVNSAVQKGMEWVNDQQDDDGSFDGAFRGIHANNFPGGPTAICLLALLKSGLSRHDDVIKKGFDYLKKTPLKKTYTVGLTLMALEARYAPQKVEARQKGHTAAFGRGRVPVAPRDLEWMKELTIFLLENLTYANVTTQNGVVVSRKVVWHYPNGPDGSPPQGGAYDSGDHSNTQYAILGLRSAQRSGVALPRDVWADVWVKVIDHFVDKQERDGPLVKRWKMIEDKKHGYVSYRPVTSRPDKARGWTYSSGKVAAAGGKIHSDATTGSMTSVGIASLIIAMEGLSAIRSPKLNSNRKSSCMRAVNDGLAWLDLNFTVKRNPGHPEGTWHYYYLYGLERAAVLANTRNIGKYDWYRVGAEYLIGAQSGGGSWTGAGSGTLPCTCFALLFLTKATIPGRVNITR
ncbi:MAG: prenyltransferase/squalene oxidase repeat-containing protein [Planctomycetota bacterium]|jgi:hypothetical protein